MVTVTIRELPESAIASSEPATSMSFGASFGTEIGSAFSGSEGSKWTTLSLAATHICPSGPATIGLSEVTVAIVNALLVSLSGSAGENEATLLIWVTQIFFSGPTAMPEAPSMPSSSNSSTLPSGLIRATSFVAPLTVIHMLPSGPATILLLPSKPEGIGKWPLTTGTADAVEQIASSDAIAVTIRIRFAVPPGNPGRRFASSCRPRPASTNPERGWHMRLAKSMSPGADDCRRAS